VTTAVFGDGLMLCQQFRIVFIRSYKASGMARHKT